MRGRMMSEHEIWACAYQLLEHLGDEALVNAGSRAGELIKRGDDAAAMAWLTVRARIFELQTQTVHTETMH